jgi:hypothetical protein
MRLSLRAYPHLGCESGIPYLARSECGRGSRETGRGKFLFLDRSLRIEGSGILGTSVYARLMLSAIATRSNNSRSGSHR